MYSRLLLISLLASSAIVARASEEGTPPEKKPGIASRFMKIFRKGDDDKSTSASWKRLALTLSIDPVQVKLSQSRQMKVTLQLVNKGKKMVQLEFPTTQRIEVLLRKADGRMVEQWSEDQAFANEPTLVAVNPGERLEYTVPVSTRELAAGETYTIEGFFPNYEQLKATKTITPEK